VDNINNAKRFEQKVIFEGMGIGMKYGTDIDWFYDDGGRRFFFADFKYGNEGLGTGQEIGFRKLVDACQRGGIDTWYMIAKHNVEDTNQPIIAKDTIVEIYYHKGTWYNCAPITLLEMKEKLMNEPLTYIARTG